MVSDVIKTTRELVAPILEEKGLELVDIQFSKERKKWFLRVFIDKPGGVDVEDCREVSEALSAKLDEADPIEGAYFLEVSSPGAERPLKNEQDLYKAVGKYVHVTTRHALEGQNVFEGYLTHFDGQVLTIEQTIKGKKKEIKISYADVAKARLAVVL